MSGLRGMGALLLLSGAAWAAQEPEKPSFSTETALVAVDVTVLDGRGRPVRGLTGEDFLLTVDGKPRRIVSAEFIGFGTGEPASGEIARPVGYSTNVGVVRGRLVLLAIDQGSIGSGSIRDVTLAADRLLDRLTTADRIGLITFPLPGPQIDFTGDHALIRNALRRVVGRGRLRGPHLGLVESLAIEEDPPRWGEVLQRECGSIADSNAHLMCVSQLEQEAREFVLEFRANTNRTLDTLLNVFNTLKTIEGSKSMILISQGLVTERNADLREIAHTAELARVSLYVLHLDRQGTFADASQDRPVPAAGEDEQLRGQGLDALATLTRGSAFNVAGSGEGIFDRIARELEGYYLIGFEAKESDRNDKDHNVRVSARPTGVTARARRSVHIARSTAEAPEQALAALLRSPLPATEVPMSVTTYTTREPSKPQLRVLVAADIGGEIAVDRSLAYRLVDSKGKVAASGGGQLKDARTFLGAASVPPGDYNLRVAVIDARHRRGSVEHSVKATLVWGEGIEVSDLMLVEPGSDGTFHPRVAPELSKGRLGAFVELYSKDSGRLANAQIDFAVTDDVDSPPLLSTRADPPSGELDGRRPAQALFELSMLPPGEYLVRASISSSGHPVGVLTRTFRLHPPAAVGSVETGSSGRRIRAAEIAPALPRFERSDALRPEILAYHLGRMDRLANHTPGEAIQAAREHVRTGHLDAVLDDLREVYADALDVAFLRGLAYLAKGQLAAAETQFKATLGHSSDFTAAPFFLGVCRVEAGQDLEAIGAWRTALALEPETPGVRPLLADALLRADQPEDTIDLLRGADSTYPSRTLGIAYAMLGRRDEALPLLTAHLDKQSADLGALFITLRLLFDSYSEGRSADPFASDPERFRRYARSYVAAHGPQQQLIARWLRYVEGKRRKGTDGSGIGSSPATTHPPGAIRGAQAKS